MNIRQIIPEKDLPIMEKWWVARKVGGPISSVPLPKRGYIVSSAGVDIAGAFLYVDVDGTWAMTEWLTTNPSMAFSKSLVDGVKALLYHMEKVAGDIGCLSIISMVAPGTGEERLLQKIGYITSEGPYHKMYGKVINREGD